jgi:hypothetical protein
LITINLNVKEPKMATEQTKQWALSTALNIIAKAAEGGYDKQPLYVELADLYKKILELNADTTSNN